MTVLALKLSRHANGVSGPARPGLAADVAPALPRTGPRRRCRSATSPTASTCELGRPADARCSTTGTSAPTGSSGCATPETWDGIETIEDAELWETQQVLKARLIDFVRRRLVAQARAAARGTRPSAGAQRARPRTP